MMMKIAKKAIKTTFRRVLWLARGTSMALGLAVMLALTAGLASTALAGTGVGAKLELGKTNTVNAISKLVGSVAGPSLQIDNNSTDANATALDLQVESGKAPMKVNSETKVANLNADKVDGKSASDFQQASAPAPQNLALINGWRKESNTVTNTPAYYKDAEGLVHLEGAIDCPPNNCPSTFASLPAGFRPNYELLLPVYTAGGDGGVVQIYPDGTLKAHAPLDNPQVQKLLTSLEGVTFRAVQ